MTITTETIRLDLTEVHRGEPGHFTAGAVITRAELGGGRLLYVIEERSTCHDSEDVWTWVVMNTAAEDPAMLLTQSEDIDPIHVEATGYVIDRKSLDILLAAIVVAYA